MNLKKLLLVGATVASIGVVATACVPPDCHTSQQPTFGGITCASSHPAVYQADVTYRAANGTYQHAYGPWVMPGHTSWGYIPTAQVQAGAVFISVEINE